MAEYVFASPVETHSVEELFRRLKAPPYGVTDGVLPVLLCAFYLVHQDEMTLYREGSLLPEPGIADWEGSVRARGRWGGRTVTGRGYLEMTGYAGRALGGSLEGAR